MVSCGGVAIPGRQRSRWNQRFRCGWRVGADLRSVYGWRARQRAVATTRTRYWSPSPAGIGMVC